MEIQALRLFASEADLNELACRIVPRGDRIGDLRISLVPAGIRVSGTYQTAIRIPFETLWRISIAGGKIAARLEELKAGPLSLGMIKSYLLDSIAAAMPLLEIRDETLLFDVDSFVQEKGLRLRTNLTSIRCDYGALIIESG
ncbi:MAG TPA: hypothetical protein VFU31_30795 [Candidatus Binatia bacterium]|nr:hypothetical protein [Candidatus Binatia bacterium]